jgi:hypothetical protein
MGEPEMISDRDVLCSIARMDIWWCRACSSRRWSRASGRRYYTDVIGLAILREFEGIVFLKVSNGYGGHTQIIGLFRESSPASFPKNPREPVHLESTSLHHFALEIDRATLAPNWIGSSAWVSR